ncbi:uncharacterized protein MYCFIDRAFT_197612 [Pseudocercospora fijiensis CIRAD86]|uniref:Uncharacterized protein n=1 Tax=Pseudocercospora fijiensis (strain CIRAD86) TaxID=383855 RepID=M3AZ73_PSEFD|nr:uncharacterized protein MYCFIDRAFT_197612 [Pseudocercospora fijiensis CIRAD86]EME82512.1 hypothetical protein MYCFIDRAFT_197612 [Pseudocercospora fijiensis CIRAD86]
MANPVAAATSPPSSAARVFAIPELFEKIVLEFIASEIRSPLAAPNTPQRKIMYRRYIEDPFRLLRIDRHTHATIVNSKRIQALCFAPTSLRIGPTVAGCPDRLIWLSIACGRFGLAETRDLPTIMLISKRDLQLDDSPWASWRKYPVMPAGRNAVTLHVMRRTVDGVVLFRKKFRIEVEWTLGELYDKIMEMGRKDEKFSS